MSASEATVLHSQWKRFWLGGGKPRFSCADPVRLAQRMQTYVFGLKIQAQRETDPFVMQRLARDLADEISDLRRAA